MKKGKQDNPRASAWDPEKDYGSLLSSMEAYSRSKIYPFHMPGHKRNTKKFGNRLPYGIDMTESQGMADLHQPEGTLLRHQEELARAFGAKKSFYMVNGSTGGNLAGIRTLFDDGDAVLVGRNCHQSVYHALELFNLTPYYLLPEKVESFGVYGSYGPNKIEELLTLHPQIKGAILTSPTYEGIGSDIETIAKIIHNKGGYLMVDQAQGAHFHWMDEKRDAIAQGADIAIESLHKTLPSLTSTSMAHLSSRVDEKRMAWNLSIFETTSPSHLLLASIDQCLLYMNAYGKKDLNKLQSWIEDLDEKAQCLKNLKIFPSKVETGKVSGVFFHDPTRIFISTLSSSLSGKDLQKALREKGFEAEMAYGDELVLIGTVGDEKKVYERLWKAVKEIDQALSPLEKEKSPLFPPLPKKALTIYEASRKKGEMLSVDQALGKISGEYVWVYPPGIPLLCPGEIFDQDCLELLKALETSGNPIKSTYGTLPEEIMVLGV